MSTSVPEVCKAENLSLAWAKAFLHAMEGPSADGVPLVISFAGFDRGLPIEDMEIRRALDETLLRLSSSEKRIYSSRTSAMLIFPHDCWRTREWSCRQEFFDFYLYRIYPRLRALDPRNRHGTYFQRLIDHTGVKTGGSNVPHKVNQLDFILRIWGRARRKGKRPRRSALQASCLDPAKDHTGSCLAGFPCLQQVSFSYNDQDELSLLALYPTEYVVSRAYGNYLGLCHLGSFMAEEMGLSLARVSVVVGRPMLGWGNKGDLRSLAKMVDARV